MSNDTSDENKNETKKQKKRVAKKNRYAEIKQRMAENEKIIGKKQMDQNRLDAQRFILQKEDENNRKLTPEEVSEKADKLESNSQKYYNNYKSKNAQQDDKFKQSATQDELDKYLKARHLTRSVATAVKLARLPDDEFDKAIEEFQKARETERRRRKRKRKNMPKNNVM